MYRAISVLFYGIILMFIVYVILMVVMLVSCLELEKEGAIGLYKYFERLVECAIQNDIKKL